MRLSAPQLARARTERAGRRDGRRRRSAAAPTWRDAATWVGLAAVPSGLLVAVTAQYLDRRRGRAAALGRSARALSPHLRDRVLAPADHPARLCGRGPAGLHPRRWLRSSSSSRSRPSSPLIALHVGVFFVCVLVCHGELARRRPARAYLTAFYMWMSAGGMIGGIAAGADRALHVQLDRGISDPDRAGGAVPARPRVAEGPLRAGRSSSARSRRP